MSLSFDSGLRTPDGSSVGDEVFLLEVDRFPHSGIGRFAQGFESALVAASRRVRYLSLTAPAGARVSPRRGRSEKLAFAGHALIAARHVRTVIVNHLVLLSLARVVAHGRPLVCLLYGHEAWSERVSAPARHTRFWAISNYTADRFQEHNPTLRVSVLPCPVDLDTFRPREARAPVLADVRHRYPHGYALTVGRMNSFERYKGFDRLVRGFAEIVHRHDRPGTGLVLVGDGTDRAELESLSVALGVQDRVTFLGTVADDTLVELYTAAKVFVLPSQPVVGDPRSGEGLGLVFLEAAATGVPVIGVAAAGASEVLPPVVGDAIPIDDDAALVAALDRRLVDGGSPSERCRRRAWVDEHHSIAATARWLQEELVAFP